MTEQEIAQVAEFADLSGGARRMVEECPGFIKPVTRPFTRPEWTEDATVYSEGWFWQNLNGDRFVFPTFEEAAEDAATDLGYDGMIPVGGLG